MKTISQRELRNDNAVIMRSVEAGEEYMVTRRGVPVALLMPIPQGTDLQCGRPAKRRVKYAGQPRARASEEPGEVLDDLRGER